MLRRSRLQATTPLGRRQPLAQVGRKRRVDAETSGRRVKPALSTRVRPAVPAGLRAALVARSGGRCEIALPGCLGAATDPAHRIGRGMGGRHGDAKTTNDRLSNVLHACRVCHDHTHHNDAAAKDDGLRLERWQTPAQEPVLYRGVLSYLTDDGQVIDFEAVGA